MQVIINIPQDHKRVIDNLVSDGKEYLLPHEVETRLAKAVKIGTVIPDDATNGDMVKAMFPNVNNSNMDLVDVFKNAKSWWNSPYKRESNGTDTSNN